MKLLSIFTPERRWVLIFGLVVMFVTSIPYILGFAMQNDEWRFTGFVFGVEDGNSYIAKMLSGSYGAWLFRSSYTGVPQNGIIAYLVYILSGKLVSPPGSHSQLVFIYHVLRLFAGMLAILATYDFISFYGLELVEGRNFSREMSSDIGRSGSYIINETLSTQLGWDTAIGKRFGLIDPASNKPDNLGTIIGVVKDFNFASLHDKIGPLFLHMESSPASLKVVSI